MPTCIEAGEEAVVFMEMGGGSRHCGGRVRVNGEGCGHQTGLLVGGGTHWVGGGLIGKGGELVSWQLALLKKMEKCIMLFGINNMDVCSI